MTESDRDAIRRQEYANSLKESENRYALDVIRGQREAARWNLLAGGVVLAAAGSLWQLAGGRAARLFAAARVALSAAAFSRVVRQWHGITRPREAERETPPWMSGLERDRFDGLRMAPGSSTSSIYWQPLSQARWRFQPSPPGSKNAGGTAWGRN